MSKKNLPIQRVKPILKWAGGKFNRVKELVSYLPDDYESKRYIEPFFGAGALFFYLGPQKSIISDLNENLINCYKQVRDNPLEVFKILSTYQKKHSSDFFYTLRNTYNKSTYSPRQAAQFLYLNKASFNGIFRVNNKGEYNVPFNKKKSIGIPTLEHLNYVSRLLKKSKLISVDYKDILKKVEFSDFVYLDPPYPPLNETAYFTHYTKERFNLEDQEELAEYANKISSFGAKVLISNANILKIKELYRGWEIVRTPARRWITCKKDKVLMQELIIKNY